MKICGFQKMTLLDFPGRVACTVFTGGCNLRCPFCHNALLVTGVSELETIPEEEVFRVLEKRKGVLDGVAITGGEPLLQPDLRWFIGKVRSLGYAVKLDTNGFYPEKLREFLEAGLLDYVAVDIKNAPERYAETAGIEGLNIEPVRTSVRYLMEGKVPYEFRTTIVKEFHGLSEIREIGKWIRGAERYFLQNFVDSGELIGEGLHACTKEEMQELLREARLYVQNAQLRGI